MKTVLTGITRNYSNEDGELEVMENLRHDGATLRPIGDPEKIKFYEYYETQSQREYTFLPYEKIVFVHQFRGREFVISYRVTETDSNLYLLGELIDKVVAVNKDVNGYGNILSCPDLIKIVQLGIYLYVHTKDKDYTLRMEYEEKLEEIRYTKLSYNLLDINLFAETPTFDRTGVISNYYDEGVDSVVEGTIYLSQNTGSFLKFIKERTIGFMTDACFVRGAFRLKAGGYVGHTAPILLNPIGSDVLRTYTKINSQETDDTIKDGVRYCTNFKVEGDVKAYLINITIPAIPNIKEYADEIECFDVFLAPIPNILTDYTAPRRGQKSDNTGIKVGNNLYPLFFGATYIFESGDLAERIKGISVENFKYIKSYSLEEIKIGIKKDKLPLEDFNDGNIEMRSFSDDEFFRDKLNGNPFIYNNMLHLGGVKQEWFEGYSPESYLTIVNKKESTGGGDTGGDSGSGGTGGGDTGGGGTGVVGGNKYYCWCGYTYYEEAGDLPNVMPGTPFNELPEDWTCPICGSPKDIFEADSGNTQSLRLMAVADEPVNPHISTGILKGISVSYKGLNKVYKSSIDLELDTTRLRSLLTYPRIGMEKVIIKAIVQVEELYAYYFTEKDLKDFPLLTASYAMGDITSISYKATSKDGKTDKDCISQYINEVKIPFLQYKEELDYSFLIEPQYPREIRGNILRVSDVLNPLIFPVEQTYEIGQGEIKELAVIDTALSQGQFGQYPLYVFCSDGVYAMNVGTDTAYTNVAPVSRDVITGDIISIDKAVAFISDRGLKIMQGDKATDVSLVMQSNSYEQLQGERFEKFIKDAKLAYNYFFGEIYLFREDKVFAFVYELKNQTWGTRKIEFKGKIDVYPDLYIQDKDNVVYKLSREKYPPDGTQKVKLKTRPMKWGDGFKKIARMIVRSLVIGKWTIRILASNDGVNFLELRNVNIDTNTPKRDIPFRRISGSFKYYVLEIEADMDERAYIEFIETELQESIFNKRIR